MNGFVPTRSSKDNPTEIGQKAQCITLTSTILRLYRTKFPVLIYSYYINSMNGRPGGYHSDLGYLVCWYPIHLYIDWGR